MSEDLGVEKNMELSQAELDFRQQEAWVDMIKMFEHTIISKIMVTTGWPHHKSYLWYETPNPNFGGPSPKRLVYMGRGVKVEQFVDAAIEENIHRHVDVGMDPEIIDCLWGKIKAKGVLRAIDREERKARKKRKP